MNYDENRLYNSDAKLHFLEDYNISEGTKNIYYATFLNTAKIERQLKKDLYQMTDDEISKVLHAAKKKSEQTVATFFSCIKTYTDWASENGRYITKDFSIFSGVTFSQVSKNYVSKNSLALYTQEELYEYYENFNNSSDKLIIQCAFEGIRGRKMSELLNMKVDHLSKDDEKYYIDLYDTESGTERLKYEISKYLYNLILETNDEHHYIDPKGAKQELALTEYVLKKSRRGRNTGDDRVQDTYVYNRIKMYKEVFEANHFRLAEIETSGIMDYLYKLIKDREGDVITVTWEDLEKISDRYNFGKYIHSTTLELTIGYSVIKSRIDLDFFNDNYRRIEMPVRKAKK